MRRELNEVSLLAIACFESMQWEILIDFQQYLRMFYKDLCKMLLNSGWDILYWSFNVLSVFLFYCKSMR